MRFTIPLSVFLLLAGIAVASEGPVIQQGRPAGEETVKGAYVVNTVTAHEGELLRRIAALENEITAGGDEESLQRQIIALKAEGEQQRLVLLVQECLASGRSEEAALAQAELDRQRAVHPATAVPGQQVLTLEEKQALGGTGRTAPAGAASTSAPSTLEGGR